MADKTATHEQATSPIRIHAFLVNFTIFLQSVNGYLIFIFIISFIYILRKKEQIE